MGESTAIVLAAILSPVITFIAAGIIWYLRSRTEKKERFFYEVFPKRLALYEEIIKATDFLSNTEEALLLETPMKLSDYYKQKCDVLADLGFRCSLFGSTRIVSTLALLMDAIAEFNHLLLSLHETHQSVRELVISFTPSAISIKLKLIEFIREESGTYMIDKETNNFLRNIKKKNCLPKKNIKKNNAIND